MGFLEGRVALVTGGGRGIGRAISEALAGEGARVGLTARLQEDADRAAGEIGRGAFGLACDVRSEEQVGRMFEALDRAAGGLDVLVNNAGIGLFGTVEETAPADWRAVIETNLSGAFYCARLAVPRMRARGGGYIVNVSSLAGKNPFPGGAAYNASKFGLNGFAEALMLEVRGQGIRVSTVMPGSVATGFGAGSAEKQDWALRPEDVAEVVLDLLRSPERAIVSRVEMRPSRPPGRS